MKELFAPYTCCFTALDWTVRKRTFIGMVEAGEPLIQQAVDALREYHQAQEEARRLMKWSVCTCLPSRFSRLSPINSVV
ncbi:hypothetical protein [Pseudomonas putida]